MMFGKAIFTDRIDAGKHLAKALVAYKGREDVIVLALPRGGVPVGFEVCKALRVPLDVFLVRKLGVPGYEELAFGAIAMGGTRVFNESVIEGSDLSKRHIEAVIKKEEEELGRRNELYREGRGAPELGGKTVILVDDGLATGATMRAAVAAVKTMGPERVVVATPLAAPEVYEMFKKEVDEMVCLETPEPFHAIGPWYERFSQTTDSEVTDFLRRAKADLQD